MINRESATSYGMSYQKKKLKKSNFSQLKYKFGLVKVVLLQRTTALRQKLRSIGVRTKALFPTRKETEEVPMFDLKKAIKALRKYDRLENNPDTSKLERIIIDQLQESGLLRLNVFVCPKFSSKALLSKMPENYIPIESGPDLFEPRIQKILDIRRDLFKAGLPTEINLLIGDNDAEEYIFPFMNSVIIDKKIYQQRQKDYRFSFEQRCQKIFSAQNCIIWSLAENGVIADETEPIISLQAINKELNFFRWLFSIDGPYKGLLSFSEDVLMEMIKIKYQLYGAQGKFLELLGGVLLQTEGPGVWLERTAMLKCTGSPAIPAIYPWIRKKENF